MIPAEDFEAGDRGGSIVNTPAVDLERKLIFAGTGNPASQRQNERTNALLKIDADPESPTFGQILASQRGTSDSYPAPAGHRLAGLPDRAAVAGRALLVRAVRLQLPGVAGAVGPQRRAPVVRRAAEVGRVHRGGQRDDGGRAGRRRSAPPCFGCNLSSSAVDANGIYVATTGGNLYSLNRDTGAIQWATPLTGTFRFNGVSVANGVVYSLNDALGALQAFDASTARRCSRTRSWQDTQTPMHDQGNSSGVSVARNTVFATSQWDNTSTLFALKLGETAAVAVAAGRACRSCPQPPDGGGLPGSGRRSRRARAARRTAT